MDTYPNTMPGEALRQRNAGAEEIGPVQGPKTEKEEQ